MNKRVEKKTAKKVVVAKQAAREAQGIKSVPEALKDVGESAERLVRSVVHEVEGRADDALSGLKDKVNSVEEQAEALVAKVPAVGETVVRKLRNLTHS